MRNVQNGWQIFLTPVDGVWEMCIRDRSTEITAGDVKRIELVVRNTGSSLLKDIQLSANKPVDWEVSFAVSYTHLFVRMFPKTYEIVSVVCVIQRLVQLGGNLQLCLLYTSEYGNKVKRFCHIPQPLRFIPNI